MQKGKNDPKSNHSGFGGDPVYDPYPGFLSPSPGINPVILEEFSDNSESGFRTADRIDSPRSPGGSSSLSGGWCCAVRGLLHSQKFVVRACRSAWRTRSRRAAARRPAPCRTCPTSTVNHSPPATRCTPDTPSSTQTHPPPSSRSRSQHAAECDSPTVVEAPSGECGRHKHDVNNMQ